MSEKYISFLTPQTKPFNPLDLVLQTDKIICKDLSRKYTDFYCTGVYGGISTGYAVGCCLRCVFCWVNWSRDFPFKAGRFFTSKQVFEKLVSNARKKGVRKLRISGSEPTLCSEHLLSLLDLINETQFLFIMETNGLLLGADPEFVSKLKKYKNIHVRVSLKAGTADGFEKRTGGEGKFFDLPFKAIRNLKQADVNFHVAAMTDPRLMFSKERDLLYQKLSVYGYNEYLEEEQCDPYSSSLNRLKKAGFELWK